MTTDVSFKAKAEKLLGLRFRPFRRSLAPKDSYQHRGGFSISAGWVDLLVDFGQFLEDEGLSDQVVITDVTEKFGELRIHTSTFKDWERNEPIWTKAKELQARSAVICELCGAEGSLSKIGGIKTCCPEHQETGWRFDDGLIQSYWAERLPLLEQKLANIHQGDFKD